MHEEKSDNIEVLAYSLIHNSVDQKIVQDVTQEEDRS
jgi:hypothetical protein